MTFATPYDGSSKLFQIGTRPIAISDWLEPDESLAAQIIEKDRLYADKGADVFADLPGSEAAQTELLSVLTTELPRFHSKQYLSHPDGLFIPALNQVRPIMGEAPALRIASGLVQDDLLILERDEAVWRLTAASLCFPSSWVLADKIGKGLADIHGPVPGFGPGTRSAQIMARMFDAARPETPMLRWNFSLYGDNRLYHPDSLGPDERRFGNDERADPVTIRVERQTLRKLPQTGALAFTIRISLQPIALLHGHTEKARIADALINQIASLSPEQLAYKGLSLEKERLITRLAELKS